VSTTENKALVHKFWEHFSAGNFVQALDMLTEDATWWVAGSTVLSATYTKAEFAELVGKIGPMAPQGLSVTPKLLTAEDDRVSVEAVSHGEINNGKTYQNIYHFMMVVRDGKFCAVREYLDTEHVTDVFAD
jgi:ketosteroid isomerase-like protein